MNKLTIIRCLPGSGKSTYAARNYPNTFHVETDMFHIHDGEYDFNPHVKLAKRVVAKELHPYRPAERNGCRRLVRLRTREED